MTCHALGVAAAGQYMNVGTVIGTTPSGTTVTASDPSHYFGVLGGIAVVKLTNGQDANEPPGPFVPVGGPVTWTYQVRNTGNTDLTNVRVDDSRGVAVTCPKSALVPAESMTCTGQGVAEPDQYTNLATAFGDTPLGLTVQGDDPSSYFGADPSIQIIKTTNGVGAALPPGPLIRVGAPVEWGYLVVNTGTSPLTGVTVTDDKGVAITCPDDALVPTEQMFCTATGTAAIGQYDNVGSVTAAAASGGTVSDSNPSHYFGATTAVVLEKLVDGDDADTAPGPEIPEGATVCPRA